MCYFHGVGRAWVASLTLVGLVTTAELGTRTLSAQESEVSSLRDVKQLLSKQKDGEVDNGGKQCGISCLYIFLKLHGVQHVAYSEIEACVPIGEHGASLQALAEASQQLGFRAFPVRCSPGNLSALRLPVIAHLESCGDQRPYLHYVVITEVGESEITLFDPLDNEIQKVKRRETGALLSGHFLASTVRPVIRVGTILTAVGLLLSGLGTWQIVRAWRRARLWRSTGVFLQHGSVCFVVAFSCCVPGCRRAVSEHSSPENVQDKVVRLIEAENTSLDLGQLRWKSEAKGEFQFRNKSAAPVQIRLGPADCSCLKVDLKAKEVLAPEEGGCLSLYLDTTHQLRAGKLEACVPLFADAQQEPLVFCVRGFLDGIVFPREKYVIRPAHHRKGMVPSFHFDVVTHTLTDLRITSITCAAFAELKHKLPKEHEHFHAEMALTKTPSPVAAVLTRLSISPPMYQASEAVYVRHVEVPMRLAGSPTAYGGKIIVDFVLGGENLQAVTDLLVIGLDAN